MPRGEHGPRPGNEDPHQRVEQQARAHDGQDDEEDSDHRRVGSGVLRDIAVAECPGPPERFKGRAPLERALELGDPDD